MLPKVPRRDAAEPSLKAQDVGRSSAAPLDIVCGAIVSDAKVWFPSQEPDPSGHSPSSGKDWLPSETLRGGNKRRRRGRRQLGLGDRREGGKGPSPKAID